MSMDFAKHIVYEANHKIIEFEDALILKDYRHAAHCFIYALNSKNVLGRYPSRAAVMMQFRFDGMLGFPGGLVDGPDEGLNITSGLRRELKEEINLNTIKYPETKFGHVVSHVNQESKLCVHLYKLEVSLNELESIEKNSLDACEFGNETMGLLRVPLYTMEDGVKGFPAFLANQFIGNARDQLLCTLVHTQLMTLEEIHMAVMKWKEQKYDISKEILAE